jgi:hypothetical protein
MPTAVEDTPTADERTVSASAKNGSGPENKNDIIMPTAAAAVVTCQPTNEKKRKEAAETKMELKSKLLRKEATASANDERHSPQKKKYRYECSAEGCKNRVVKGGVCVKHGAQLKRCSSEGCTNQVQKGEVCVKHGAQLKRCSVDGCANNAKKGGVCWRHEPR